MILPQFKINDDQNYIAKCPVTVWIKEHGSKGNYEIDYGVKQSYVWLNYDKQGNINKQLRFYDGKHGYKIPIPQWQDFSMTLTRLNIRPIEQATNRLMVNPRIKKYPDISTAMGYDTVKAKYNESLWALRNILNFSDGELKEQAEKQIEILLRKEWILGLLYEIDMVESFTFTGNNTKKLNFEKIE